MLTPEEIAQITHSANRSYQILLGEDPAEHWCQCSDELKASVIDGVNHVLENSNCSPGELHQNWVEFKTSQGWVFGDVKDAEAKTHPCLLPFKDLPEAQQRKDYLFMGIIFCLNEDLEP